MTTILAVFSDLHCGSTLGMCPIRYPLMEGGVYDSNKAQRWMLRHWDADWKFVQELAEKRQAPIWCVSNGDLCDGNHHGTHQIISKDVNEHIEIAIGLLEPVTSFAERFFVVAGTPSHVGENAWMEERIARDLSAEGDDHGGRMVWWMLPLECDGVRFDFAHHGRGGMLPWTRANSANQLASLTIQEYAESGDRLPHVVIRSHKHNVKDSGLNYPVRVLYTPAWQMPTGYVNAILPGAIPQIGMFVFICNDGQYELVSRVHSPKRKRRWKIPPTK